MPNNVQTDVSRKVVRSDAYLHAYGVLLVQLLTYV